MNISSLFIDFCFFPNISKHLLALFYFYFWIFIFFKFSIILLLFSYSCLHFLLTSLPYPSQTTSLPCFHPPPWFCPYGLYSSSWKPFSPLFLPPSPLATIKLFLTSMSLVIFCLFFSSVDYVPVKGEILWYLYLTAWLISLT